MIHPAAENGFGTASPTYITGRPDYPAGVVDWLRTALGLGPGRAVLDLGAGTGKFIPSLRATDADIVAVEPVAAMRAAIPGDITTLAGTAEAIPLPDAAVDAVVCAQAFHWFANLASLAEIHRVLRPGGSVGLVWNVRDHSVPWVVRHTAIIDPHEGDAPRYIDGTWRSLFPGHGFGPLHETRFDNVRRGPAEQVVLDRTLSISFIAALPPAERERIADQVRALIRETPELNQAEVAFPYLTSAFVAARL